jgi:hypothetical protein
MVIINSVVDTGPPAAGGTLDENPIVSDLAQLPSINNGNAVIRA